MSTRRTPVRTVAAEEVVATSELVPGINRAVDLLCEGTAPAPAEAEARGFILQACGPLSQLVLRASVQAAVANRERRGLRTELAQLLEGAQLRGIVTGFDDGRLQVQIGPAERLLRRPEGLRLGIGQTVRTDADGRSVVGVGKFLIGGTAYELCERLERRCALVRSLRDGLGESARQLALVADNVDLETLAVGDHVLGWTLDGGNVVLVTRRLDPPKPRLADAHFGRPVTRADIVGLEEIIERVELLFLAPPSPEHLAILAEAMGALHGVVFQGAPGSGKTLLALYFVTLVRQRGGRALYRTAGEFLSKWVGEGAARLRTDLAALDASFTETGVRPLLVIDELEAIGLDRTHVHGLAAGHLDVLDELLGRITESEARVIGISNLADRFLDQALVRDGRLTIVPFPPTLAPEQIVALVARCLARVPLAADEEAQ